MSDTHMFKWEETYLRANDPNNIAPLNGLISKCVIKTTVLNLCARHNYTVSILVSCHNPPAFTPKHLYGLCLVVLRRLAVLYWTYVRHT